jgi:hypothetical protein
VRWTVQRAIFHLLEEPVPTLAGPFREDDPLPGAYELHLPSDGVTIWSVVALYQGQEIISIQLVRLDTRQIARGLAGNEPAASWRTRAAPGACRRWTRDGS